MRVPWNRAGRPALALTVIAAAYLGARPPHLSGAARASLAAPFRFERFSLWSPPGGAASHIRQVHPSLARIAAWISSVGAAVALGDLDGDGLDNDVCHVDPRWDTVAVSPAPGSGPRFEPFVLDFSAARFDARVMAPMGCLPGDLNEDGRMDLLIYFWGRPPLALLRRDAPLAPDGFLARSIGDASLRWHTNAVTRADIDGDGHPDLVVGNYFADGARILDPEADGRQAMQHSMSRAANGGHKHFLIWAGGTGGDAPDVRYREVGGVVEASVDRGWSLAVGASDLDGDLLPELYFANDFGPDHLLHNRSTPGRPRFVAAVGQRRLTVPRSKTLGRDSFKGMGVDFGDLNGDGWPDFVVSNIAAEFALEESHFAFLSTGRLSDFALRRAPYVDRSEPLGLSRSGWAWDVKLADLDNDGSLEVIQATGFVRGLVSRWPELHELAMANDQLLDDPRYWPRFDTGDDLSGHDPNALFVRGPDGRFHDVAAEVGFADDGVSRGVALADVDGDGRLDVAMANQWSPSSLYVNRSASPGRSLTLRLERPVAGRGSEAGSPVIGARVRVTLPNGRRLTAETDGGNGHSGKRSAGIHVGLGPVAPDAALDVEISWRRRGGGVGRQNLTLRPGRYRLRLDESVTVWPTLERGPA